jgi:outer-membrane receptor for ferric coprogen and ferric-rhodotorulic acid
MEDARQLQPGRAPGYSHSRQKFRADSRAADYAGGYPAVGEYGVARFSLSNPMKAIVGARLTSYDKSGVGARIPAYRMKHDQELTRYAGVVYDISESLSAYAGYTDIFQAQNQRQVPRWPRADPVTEVSAR